MKVFRREVADQVCRFCSSSVTPSTSSCSRWRERSGSANPRDAHHARLSVRRIRCGARAALRRPRRHGRRLLSTPSLKTTSGRGLALGVYGWTRPPDPLTHIVGPEGSEQTAMSWTGRGDIELADTARSAPHGCGELDGRVVRILEPGGPPGENWSLQRFRSLPAPRSRPSTSRRSPPQTGALRPGAAAIRESRRAGLGSTSGTYRATSGTSGTFRLGHVIRRRACSPCRTTYDRRDVPSAVVQRSARARRLHARGSDPSGTHHRCSDPIWPMRLRAGGYVGSGSGDEGFAGRPRRSPLRSWP